MPYMISLIYEFQLDFFGGFPIFLYSITWFQKKENEKKEEIIIY